MESTERLLQLFDTYWFNYDILTNKTAANPENINDHQAEIDQESAVILSKLSSFYIRSSCSSDQYFFDSKHSSSFISSISTMLSFSEQDRSPNSVLMSSRIFGKDQVDDRKQEEDEEERKEAVMKENKKRFARRKKGGCGGRSKSLSELEFEELKGFMDLGFVFSEEDKDSRLASILPGLQRLQRKKAGADIYSQINTGGTHYQVMNNSTSTAARGGELQEVNINITRPYLSEAWGWDTDNNMQEESKEEDNQMLLMNNWRLPSLSNEIDMKKHLRLWAHTVASTLVS